MHVPKDTYLRRNYGNNVKFHTSSCKLSGKYVVVYLPSDEVFKLLIGNFKISFL